MSPVSVACVCAALVAIAWVLDTATPASYSTPPSRLQKSHVLQAPLLCAAGLPYEPALSLLRFTTTYKVWHDFARALLCDEWQGKRPVVFAREVADRVLETTRYDALLEEYGFEMVTLASSNSFSYSKRRLSLRTYMEQHMQPQPPAALANETWYMFGDTTGGRWAQVRGDAPCVHLACRLTRPQLLNELPPAPMDGELHDPAVTFGLAGMLSGVSFHTHGAVFAEVSQAALPRLPARLTCLSRCSKARSCGSCPRRPTSPCSTATSRRCRSLHPARMRPFAKSRFLPAQWLLQYGQLPQQSNYSAQDLSAHLLQSRTLTFRQQPQSMLSCMLRPGHVLYIPPHWWHATLNVRGYNFFTSYFIQEAVQHL